MAFKRSITRKQFLKQPDEFITIAQRMMNFVQQNTRLIYSVLMGVAGVVVLGGIVWLYLNGVKREARNLENNALELYHQPVLTEEDRKLGRTGFNTDEERYRAALNRFQQVVDKYGWTDSAQRALIYIGDCYYGLKDYEQAKQAYEQYLAKYPDDKLMGYIVRQSLGYVSEAQDKLDEAIDYYRDALRQETAAGKFQLYLDIARCYEIKQDWKQALATYKEVTANFPLDPKVRDMEQHIEELEAIVLSSANSPQSSS
jgi:tetratricopeptide (TPR) repeat protein